METTDDSAPVDAQDNDCAGYVNDFYASEAHTKTIAELFAAIEIGKAAFEAKLETFGLSERAKREYREAATFGDDEIAEPAEPVEPPDWRTLVAPAILDREVEMALSRKGEQTRPGDWVNKKATVRDWLKVFTNHKESESKDGDSWCQGPVLNGERRNESVPVLYWLGLDLDTGESIERMRARLEELGLFATLYTTHSHMKNETAVKKDAIVDYCKRNEPEAQDVCRFLVQKRRYQPAVLMGAELTGTVHTSEGVQLVLRHQPMPKFRVVLLLKDPFVVAERPGTQKSAMVEWRERYAGVARMLGAHYDRKTTDLARLFFSPRHRKGAPFETHVIPGDCLDLDKVERVTREMEQDADLDEYERAAKEMGGGKKGPGTYQTPGLMEFAVTYSKRFEIEDCFDDNCDENRGAMSSGPGTVFKCPRDDFHGNAGDVGDKAFFCINASNTDGGGFVARCHHDSCSDFDRLDFLDAFCVENGIKSADELVRWCLPEEGAGEDDDTAEETQANIKPATEKAASKAITNLTAEEDGSFDVDAIVASIGAGVGAGKISMTKRNRLLEKLRDKTGLGIQGLKTDATAATNAYRQQAKKDRAEAKSANGSGRPDWEEDHPEDPEEAVDWMNDRYMVAPFGNDYVCFDRNTDVLLPLPKSTVFDMMANRKVLIEKEDAKGNMKWTPSPIAPLWFESPKRLQYKRVVFKPSEDTKDGDLNLFRGWSVTEAGANEVVDYSPFRRHLFHNVCGDNPALFAWVWSWCAQIVQDPETKPGTALAMRGKKGAGKGMAALILRRLMWNNSLSVSSADRVFGRFNAHLARALLCVLNEAFWAGSKDAESALKDLITEPTFHMEPKGVDGQDFPSYVRLMIVGNASWLFPASEEERRFTLCDVGNDNREDHEFFGKINKLMEPGGIALRSFFRDLRRTDIPDFINLRSGLWTKALEDNMDDSAGMETEWIAHCAAEKTFRFSDPDIIDRNVGEAPWPDSTPCGIPTRLLYASYEGFCRQSGRKQQNIRQFGRWLSSKDSEAFVVSAGEVMEPVRDDYGDPTGEMKPVAGYTLKSRSDAEDGLKLERRKRKKIHDDILDRSEMTAWEAFGRGDGKLPT